MAESQLTLSLPRRRRRRAGLSVDAGADPGLRWALTQGVLRPAGVDEAGRGPLAGPVVAAAVILDPSRPIEGLDDSKKLTRAARERLAQVIRQRALACAVVFAEVEEIDTHNILQATLRAMRRAVSSLDPAADGVLVDGNQTLGLKLPEHTLVGGDALSAPIAAASILAKTARDAHMIALDLLHPGYGFARHKGYGTAQHLAALRQLGPCAQHRRSFAPVREVAEARGG
jgi:ribonuclease HII